MSPKSKWWAEFAIDGAATFVLGWLLLGGIVAAMLAGAGEGELGKAIPVIGRIAVTYATWKLFRSFNWLKGVPPSNA